MTLIVQAIRRWRTLNLLIMHISLPTLLLTACGNNTAQHTSGAQSISSVPRLFNASTSGSGGGLLVKTSGVRCGSYLVITDLNKSYDSTKARLMASYVLPYSERYLTFPLPDLLGDAYLGQTVGVVRGGQQYYHVLSFESDPGVDETPPGPLQWVAGGPDCFAALTITNIGTSTMQITNMGVTLVAAAVRNDYTYNLLNICSVQADQQCHPALGGANGLCAYYAQIRLNGGATGAHFDAPLTTTEGANCPLPLTIEPGNVAYIYAKFSSAPWLYKAKLTFNVRTSSGSNRVVFSSLQQNLAFIDDTTRFNCYGLDRDTFVREEPQTLTPDEERSHVCL
ncbi:MAG TPA: hypothetical protein VH349_12560 [Ktedonobacterales bacterium]